LRSVSPDQDLVGARVELLVAWQLWRVTGFFDKAKVDNPRLYFKTYNDKANLTPPAEGSDWYKLVSVDLGNGPKGMPGDSVGVVAKWEWPDLPLA
jgi:hypothetical protein